MRDLQGDTQPNNKRVLDGLRQINYLKWAMLGEFLFPRSLVTSWFLHLMIIMKRKAIHHNYPQETSSLNCPEQRWSSAQGGNQHHVHSWTAGSNYFSLISLLHHSDGPNCHPLWLVLTLNQPHLWYFFCHLRKLHSQFPSLNFTINYIMLSLNNFCFFSPFQGSIPRSTQSHIQVFFREQLPPSTPSPSSPPPPIFTSIHDYRSQPKQDAVLEPIPDLQYQSFPIQRF